jgi:hypothetical protein
VDQCFKLVLFIRPADGVTGTEFRYVVLNKMLAKLKGLEI